MVQNCTMTKPAARNRLIEEPSLNNPNHVFEVYEESGSDVDYIEDSLTGENKKNSKEGDYTNMIKKKELKQANLLKLKTAQYHHNIPRKKAENEKALVTNEMELSHLGKNIFIGDSAATSHMTSNKVGVYNLVPINGSVTENVPKTFSKAPSLVAKRMSLTLHLLLFAQSMCVLIVIGFRYLILLQGTIY